MYESMYWPNMYSQFRLNINQKVQKIKIMHLANQIVKQRPILPILFSQFFDYVTHRKSDQPLLDRKCYYTQTNMLHWSKLDKNKCTGRFIFITSRDKHFKCFWRMEWMISIPIKTFSRGLSFQAPSHRYSQCIFRSYQNTQNKVFHYGCQCFTKHISRSSVIHFFCI